MAVTYRTSLKTTRMTSVKTDIDSGGAAGSIEIGTTGMGTVLAVLPLSYPCGTVSTDTLTFSAITSDSSADATGTAAEARIKTSGGTVIVSGLTVGTSGANINLNTTSITAGGTVSLSSGSLQHG